MGEQALDRPSLCVSAYYTDFMFCLHSDLTRALVVAGVLHSVA